MTSLFYVKSRMASAFFVVAMGSASAAGAATTPGPQLTVSSLQTDALIAPLGIADLTPKLSWIDTANVNLAVQTGYEIQAAASASDLAAGELLWDSGHVQSAAQYAQYGGTPLASRSAVTWQVRVWDGTGAVSAWSAPTTFQIGLTKPSDWTADWITSPSWLTTASMAAMPLFAKQFVTSGSSIMSARLYVSGIGIVVPSINGVNVGSAVLAPGSSNLAAHLAYSTFDVTSMLTAGSSNVLGIALGLGPRFVQPDSAAQGYRYVSPSGATTTDNGLPRAIAQLEITYNNGTTTTIGTDATWQTALGPTTVSAWWGGESYDATREVPGWNLPGTNRSSWAYAYVTTAPFPSTELAPRAAPALTVVQQIAGTDMGSPVAGSELYNFGVNAAGREQFTISAPLGTTLTFTPAEMLQNGAAFQNAGTTGVPVFDQFTSNGNTETWSPQFSYHGFQYMQVSGITSKVKITAPTLLVVRANNSPVGSFQSSDATINAIHTLVNRAVQSNMYSVLTDCPSREKGGWDEEVHLLFSMVARSYDVDAYGVSLVQNMADAQLSDGLVPDLVPENIVFSSGFRDDVNWGSAIIQTPWQIYQNYGDSAVLSSYYANMTSYMNYLQTRVTGSLVSYGSSGLGDWGETSVTSVTTPIDLVENWGYYRDEVAMANIAKVLGKAADQQQYTAKAAATLAAFTATWYNPSTMTVANGTQSSLAMALDIGAVPASTAAAVTQKLVAAINAAGGFAVGEIGLTPLFRVLSAAGYQQLIYNAVTSRKVGGYGYFVAQQLTSLPEYWNITSGSRNHWMLGGVDNWITGNIAGIEQASGSVDFQNIVIQPAIVGNMTSASGSFETNHGTIQSSWSNGSSGFALSATIPVGSTGTINLPITSPLPATPAGATYAGTASGFAQYQVGAGTYAFAGAGAVAAAATTPPLGATFCAYDYGTCTIPANKLATVWYGAGTTWDVFPSRSGSFTCLPATFGVQDPLPNVQKSCEIVLSTPPATATFCAFDYGTCTIPAKTTATVWYGAGTVWDVFPSRSGSFTCLPATFGVQDPLPNVQKSCELVAGTP